MSKKNFQNLIQKTYVLPEYMKNIYLTKLKEGRYSEHWVSEVASRVKYLEQFTNSK